MIYAVLLLFFIREIPLNRICLGIMVNIGFFLSKCSGESVTLIFSPTTTNIDGEVFSYSVQV